MPGPVKSTGIVVNRFDYGNTSRIIVFLSPDRGQVRALAKGARRPRGGPGLGGGLDLLSESEILYYERRSGLSVLAEWSEKRSFPQLGRDPVRMAAGMVCAEFARSCSTEGEESTRLYELLAGGADSACRAERLVPAALHAALGMLSVAGFRPAVEACVGCGAELTVGEGRRKLLLSARLGGIICPGCRRSASGEDGGGPLSAEAVALLGALLRLEAASAARLRPSRAAEGELLAAVESFASWCLERAMRSLSGLGGIIAGLEAVGCR